MVALKPGPCPKQGMPPKKKKGMRRYDPMLEGPLSPRGYMEAIAKRQKIRGSQNLRCPVSGVLLPWWEFKYHHPYEKWMLRRDGLFHLVWDPRNGIAVAPRVHERHHSAVERIPGEVLSPLTFEFAAEIGPAAIKFVSEKHP